MLWVLFKATCARPSHVWPGASADGLVPVPLASMLAGSATTTIRRGTRLAATLLRRLAATLPRLLLTSFLVRDSSSGTNRGADRRCACAADLRRGHVEGFQQNSVVEQIVGCACAPDLGTYWGSGSALTTGARPEPLAGPGFGCPCAPDHGGLLAVRTTGTRAAPHAGAGFGFPRASDHGGHC